MLSILSDLEGSCTALERFRAACMEKMSHWESPFLKEESLFWGKLRTEVEIHSDYTDYAMMCLFLMWDTSRQITRAERHHMNPMLLSARWIKFEFLGLQANADTKERLGKKWGRGSNNWGWNPFGGERGTKPAVRVLKLNEYLRLCRGGLADTICFSQHACEEALTNSHVTCSI